MALAPSNAARSQAYITRARIGFIVYARILVWLVIAWALLTVYVVWRETGQYFPQFGHQYFGRWAICSTLVGSPIPGPLAFYHFIPTNGARYSMAELADWLDGDQMYRLPFTFWFWHYALYTSFIPIGIVAAGLFWRLRHMLNVEHLRGLQLLTVRQHNRQLNGGWLQRTWRKVSREPKGMTIGSVTLPLRLEREHFLILGSTGTGKTSNNRELLDQIQDRGEHAIIYDPDRDYLPEYYDESRGDLVLCPVDLRMPFWTPWAELRDQFKPIDAAALAASIIRGRPQNDQQDYFQRNARALVRGMFEAIPVKDRDNLEVFADFLKQARDKIRARLENTKAPATVIDPGAHDSGGSAGIIGVTDTAIEGFGYMPRRDQTSRTWSAREWAANPCGWLFLTSDPTTKDAVQAIQGIWVDCLVRWLMDRPYDAPHVWIFAEEAPSMGFQPQLKELATRGRKRNLTLVMCAQSISQLREIYGHDGATTLISAPSTKVILRVDETEMAEWASQQLGSREIERLQMAQLAGVSSYREGINLQPQHIVERLVMADQIKLLPPLSGYLCIAGHDRTCIKINERHLVERQPALIPRTYGPDTPGTATTATGKPQPRWKTV